MDGNPDGAGLVGDGPGDGLADPPGGVSGELEAPAVVEAVHRPHQPQVAFLDEVEHGHPPPHVVAGDGDHQSQVGLHQPAMGGPALAGGPLQQHPVLGAEVGLLGEPLRRLATRLHLHGQLHLLLSGEQPVAPDLLQVHLHRVGNRHQLVLVEEVVEHVGALLGDADPLAAQQLEDPLEVLGGGPRLRQVVLHLGGSEEATLGPPLDEGFDGCVQLLAHPLRLFSCSNAINSRKVRSCSSEPCGTRSSSRRSSSMRRSMA